MLGASAARASRRAAHLAAGEAELGGGRLVDGLRRAAGLRTVTGPAVKSSTDSSSGTSTCFGVSPPRSTLSELAIISTPTPSRYAWRLPAGRKSAWPGSRRTRLSSSAPTSAHVAGVLRAEPRRPRALALEAAQRPLGAGVAVGARAKSFLRHGEHVGARRSDGLIAVSRLMQTHIQSEHGVGATYIPNGATLPARPPGTAALERRGLTPGGYLLTVGRIIPDRDLHTLIAAFNQSHRPKHLVIVGSETTRTEYGRRLEGMAGDRVLFTGDIFGEELEELYAHCLVYCLASRVEGLPITVCEAMAHSRPLILSDIPENVEVGGDAARYFRCGDVNALLQSIEDTVDDEAGRAVLSRNARRRCETIYNWDLVADQVEAFYYRVLGGGAG